MLRPSPFLEEDVMNKWIKKTTHELFNRRTFSLIDIECYHPDKHISNSFFTLNTLDWTNVIAETDGNRFITVQQHRLGTDEITIETPGGLIELNEQPEETAARELLEETGYKAEEMHLLKKLSVNPAILNNYIYIFYAKRCKKICDQKLDTCEDIEVLTFTRDEIADMLREGVIHHSITVTAFYQFFLSKWSGVIGSESYLQKILL
jgi:ADP-ribose pyrophosphatase